MKKKPTLFFRNDDIRGNPDQLLSDFTSLFVAAKVPVAHAVEPANITPETASWLNGERQRSPHLVELIQHGYDHNLSHPEQKMEFGGHRGFDDQYKDILSGKEIMNTFFGTGWTPVFSFPYGSFNKAALEAVDRAGYQAISSKIRFSKKSLMKNFIGKSLGKDMIFGKKVNYHPGIRNGYQFREISVSANLIRRYTGYDTAEHYTLNEIIGQINEASKYTNLIGVLFHHRFHQNQLPMIEQLLAWVHSEGYPVKTFKSILEGNL